MAHRSTMRCSLHHTETLTHYCEDCRDLVCETCMLLPPHRQHKTSLAEKVLPEHIQFLERYIVDANAHVQGTENLMDNLAQTNMQIQENRSAAELRIRTYFNRMRNILNERESHFVSAVRLDTAKRIESVTERRGKIKVIMDTLITSLKSIDSFVRQPDDITILRRERQVLQETDEQIQDLHEWYSAPPFDTTIILPCVEDRNFEEVCRLVGDPAYRVCPPGCTARRGRKSSSKSVSPPPVLDGTPPPRPPKPKDLENSGFLSPDLLAYRKKDRSESILSSLSVDSVATDTSDNTEQDPLADGLATPPIPPKSPKFAKKENSDAKSPNSNHTQGFFNEPSPNLPKRPIPKPRTNLGVNLQSVPTTSIEPPTPSSPNKLEISAKQMLSSSSIRGESVYPVGVGTGSNGLLVVTDTINGYIRLMTTTGKLLDCIGYELSAIRSSKDSGDEHIREPYAVAFNNSDQMLVVENSPPSILKLSNTGTFISKIAPKGRGMLGAPRGIALDHEGSVYVTDRDKMCVHVFDSSGKYVKQIANNKGRVSPQSPTGIAIDGRGRVIITDYDDHHVWIYAPDGDLLKHFGWQGHTAGDLFQPYGVAVDSKGNIFISETGNHRISVFTGSGDFITCLCSEGSDAGQLKSPKHICIDKDKLIIADEGNQRIQILDIVL